MTETIEAHDLLHGKITGVVETHTTREVFVSALRIRIGSMSCEVDIHAARGGELLIRLTDEE